MRKNGVNRELSKIEGGLCAPFGFKANGVYAGFGQNIGQKDLMLITADRPCPTACVFSKTWTQCGASVTSKNHLKKGLMQAIFVNGGVVNACREDVALLAEKACRELALKTGISANETVIATMGALGYPIKLETFENSIPDLVKGLSATAEKSKFAAEVVSTNGDLQEFAYSFKLGDIPCKIGGVFTCSGSVFLTTDVAISPEMLQKALSAGVKDTLDLLCVGGTSAPHDIACIMANGRAGNYKISSADTEYGKFAVILKEVLTEICHRIASSGRGKAFSCRVLGARSIQSARMLAKSVVGAYSVRQGLAEGCVEAEELVYLAVKADHELRCEGIRVVLNGCALFDGGRKFSLQKEALCALLERAEPEITISLGAGNYSATAIGQLFH